MTPAARPGRRDVLAAAGAVSAGAVSLAAGVWGVPRLRVALRPDPEALSEGVVVGAHGALQVLPPGEGVDYLPGTRLPADPAAWGMDPQQRDELAERTARRQQGARLPRGRWRTLAQEALADLLALTGPTLVDDGAAGGVLDFPSGAVAAAPVGAWRYVWPRDASFCAAALSSVGLYREALGVLGCLASWQDGAGALEARYTLSGRPPDDRPRQTDGVGWLMWAVGRLLADGTSVADLEAALGTCLARTTSRLLRLTDTASHLPAASPDYWEVPESVLTLGTAAPVLLGLEAALGLARAGADLGADPEELEERVATVRQAVERGFAPGWGRHVRQDDVDAALALVLPPFTTELAGAREVRQGAVARMSRPAGGVAPGSSWRRDGVSWTPQTALLAWSGVVLGMEEGQRLLGWLESHRTRAGALPEKVLADGSPAGPAPLAWTSALVVLAAGA